MEYSNKRELNEKFKCIFCDEGEHGIGKDGRYVCFGCIKELVDCHDELVKAELRIKSHEK